jgi:hypothetical protein
MIIHEHEVKKESKRFHYYPKRTRFNQMICKTIKFEEAVFNIFEDLIKFSDQIVFAEKLKINNRLH